jgi:hypothetical protein
MTKVLRGEFIFTKLVIGCSFFLLLTSSWAQQKSESEPNDSREQAQEIRVGDTIEGYFQKDNDYDWYKLILDKPGKNYIRIDVSGVPGIDSELRLYDEKVNTLWDVNDTGTGGPEQIVHFPVSPGIYYLRIYGGGKAAKEKYILSTRITDPWQEGQESEPNDRSESANEVKIGQDVGGYFEKKYDNDWYKLIVDKPGKSLVHIDVTPVPGVNIFLNLRHADGRSIWDINETGVGGPESIFNLALAQGTYYIQLSASEANYDNHYVLHTRILGSWQEGQEAEPNDRKENATELRLGQSVEGYFQKDNDYDWYKLVMDQPGKSDIQIELSAVPGVDTMFDVLDKDGKDLWRASDASKGEPETVKYLTVAEGVYYILVIGYQKNITNKYILSTRLLGPWQENEESEPNDSKERASEIKLNAPLTGRINRNDDKDYYVLSVPEPGIETIVMQLSGVPDVRWTLELLDQKENSLDESRWHEAGNGEEIVRMKFKPGTYYLYIGIRGGKNTGAEYTIYAGKPQKPPATPEEVRQALMKALDWLASKQQKNGSWSGYDQAYTGLSIMAFVGAKCAQKDYSANIRGAINYLKSQYEPSSKYPDGSKNAAYYGGQLGTREMY